MYLIGKRLFLDALHNSINSLPKCDKYNLRSLRPDVISVHWGFLNSIKESLMGFKKWQYKKSMNEIIQSASSHFRVVLIKIAKVIIKNIFVSFDVSYLHYYEVFSYI